MIQDANSGRAGALFGKTAGPLLIDALGYKKEPGPANVFMRDGKCVALKCANFNNNRVGVTDDVFKRVAFVIAAFRRSKRGFDLYELKRDDFGRIANWHEKSGPQRHATKGDIVRKGKSLGRLQICLPDGM